MNRRAARRHPPAQQKAPRAQARVLPHTGTATAARRATGASRSLRGLLYPEWARNIVSELRKVVWPTRDETRSLTVVVIVVAVTVAILLGTLDFIFSWLVEHVLF